MPAAENVRDALDPDRVSGTSPPSGLAKPKVTLCVAPITCHTTVAPGAIVIDAGLNEVPAVVTTIASAGGAGDGVDAGGAAGFCGSAAVGSTAAPPPPHAITSVRREIRIGRCIGDNFNCDTHPVTLRHGGWRKSHGKTHHSEGEAADWRAQQILCYFRA